MGLLERAQDLLGSFVPAIGVFNAVTDLISGDIRSAQALPTPRQAALLSGGAAGRTLATGSSVGPLAIQALGVAAQVGGQMLQQRGVAVRPPVGPFAFPQSPVPPFLVAEAAAGRAGGVRTVTRRQMILMQAKAASPGATAKKIVKAARDCGIELAAATFGLNVLDVCFLLAQPPTRRSRGISAADMRRTRSTIRKVTTIQAQLKQLSGPLRRRK